MKVLNKKKIESLKMGGLLAVNKGSLDDPTFTIMEWKPKNAKNKQPIVLIGKGIVYDTGGLSLKPTANSMDLMKIDMGGAGTVIGAINAIAANKLPVHVIALAPATDNRPSGNAYAPGDVINMHDGTNRDLPIKEKRHYVKILLSILNFLFQALRKLSALTFHGKRSAYANFQLFSSML